MDKHQFMTPTAFQSWFFDQPEMIQNLVVGGPPFLVMMGIGLALGARFRFLALTWLLNPYVAPAFMAEQSQKEEEENAEWADNAKASVDELIARRNRRSH